jgi:hypothetical protein
VAIMTRIKSDDDQGGAEGRGASMASWFAMREQALLSMRILRNLEELRQSDAAQRIKPFKW